MLGLGAWLRKSLSFFHRFHIPGSVIAGCMGWILIRCLPIAGGFSRGGDWDSKLASWSEMLSSQLSSWPGWLIALVFAGMLLKPTARRSLGDRLSRVGREGLMVWVIVLGQTAVGLAVTCFLIQPFFDVPNSFGMLIETGFAGGHGTAAAMGQVFNHPSIQLQGGRDLGVVVATIGLVYGLASGVIWVNLGVRRGWVKRRVSVAPSDAPSLTPINTTPLDAVHDQGQSPNGSENSAEFDPSSANLDLAVAAKDDLETSGRKSDGPESSGRKSDGPATSGPKVSDSDINDSSTVAQFLRRDCCSRIELASHFRCLVCLVLALLIGMIIQQALVTFAAQWDHRGMTAVDTLAGESLASDTSDSDSIAANESEKEFQKRLGLAAIVGSFPLFIFTLFGGWFLSRSLVFVGGTQLVDTVSLQRLTAIAMDLLVFAAIASLNLEIIATFFGPLSLLIVAGFIWTGFCLLFLSHRLLPREHWFELGLMNYGMSTGTTATGFVLLRLVDPDLKSKAAEDYALAAPLSSPFIGGGMLTIGLPLLVLESAPLAMVCILLIAIVLGLIALGWFWNGRAA